MCCDLSAFWTSCILAAVKRRWKKKTWDKHFCVNVTVQICSVWNNINIINNDLKFFLVHQTLYYNDVNMPALASVSVTNDKVVKNMPINIVKWSPGQ